jgi:hypothetical protein
VTHHYPLDQIAAALTTAVAREGLKVVVHPSDPSDPSAPSA